MVKAIVLLGYRNAGKDSVCKELQQKFSNVWNAKFGAFNKLLVSDLLEVPVSWLEDKEWRTEEYVRGVTPLELLDALFVYSNTNPKFQQKNDEHCLWSIPSGFLPVFTDIRRARELDVVIQKYGASEVDIYYLEPNSAEKTQTDNTIPTIRSLYTIKARFYGSVDSAAAGVVAHSKLTEVFKVKPTLHLLTHSHMLAGFSKLNHYEPLQNLANSAAEFLACYNIEDLRQTEQLVGILLENLSVSDIEVAEINGDSYMQFVNYQHLKFLPKLREKAHIKYHCSKAQSKNHYVSENFTSEEIVTHE